jgi:hypothetical protein
MHLYLKPKPVRPVACARARGRKTPKPTPKPAFHLHSNMPYNISMHDAEMAIETCTNIAYEDRAECYVAFGVDGRAVEKYFYIVQSMERCFYNNSFFKSDEGGPDGWMCLIKEQLHKLYGSTRLVRSNMRRAPPPADSEEL